MNVTRAAIAALLLTGAISVDAQDVVAISLRGRYYAEPATVRLLVRVEPDRSNRTLVVEADGERLFRSSELRLEGEHEQRVHTIEFKNLPAGEYVVRAEVRSNDDVRGVDEQMLRVLGHGEELR